MRKEQKKVVSSSNGSNGNKKSPIVLNLYLQQRFTFKIKTNLQVRRGEIKRYRRSTQQLMESKFRVKDKAKLKDLKVASWPQTEA